MKIMNAKITGLRWDRERGLTQWIMLEGDKWNCSFGGFFLKGNAASTWVTTLMKILEYYAMSDNDVIGKIVRVKFSGEGRIGDKIIAIGHPYKDIWLDSSVLLESLKEDAK